jgi:hypothetical protein
MSSTWLDVPEAESIDGYGGDESAEDYPEELYGDGEAFAESDDDAESRYSRRRRRARRLARARRRRRAALARTRYARAALGPPTAAAVVRKTEADVANLEVESSVQADALGSALAAQRQQIRAGTNAAAAGAVLPALLHFLQTYSPDFGNNTFFKAGLPLAPLLLLRSTDRGLNDRRLWAAAAVSGLAIADDRKSKSLAEEKERLAEEESERLAEELAAQTIQDVSIVRAAGELPPSTKVTFRAVALGGGGRPVPSATIKWASGDSNIVAVNKDTGEVQVKGTSGQVTTITATVTTPEGEDRTDFVAVKVA